VSRAALASVLGMPVAAALGQGVEDAVTVTATRVERPSLEVPASIDRVIAEDIRFARPQVNLSESLGRVPGIVVQNRQNYAQDLQISSRGFGARATFGIRGLRLLTDGIPASFPDGQGQVSHFDLGSAERIEVLRGPFSVLYGNASGGVINTLTESGAREPGAGGELALGSFGTWRAALKAGRGGAAANWIASAARFRTDGWRRHSAAERDQLNAKVSVGLGAESTLALVANALDSPEVEDPLGLTRAQMNADPRQADPVAFAFNTRKSVSQAQAGVAFEHRFGGWRTRAALFGGHRDVRQFLAISLALQSAPTHSGGVVDLDRDYGGASLRFSADASLLDRPLALAFGGEYERMAERRKGFLNNLGSIGGLKRDEDDVVSAAGVYAQAEWRFAEKWLALAGLRANRVAFRATDYFVAGPANQDDSGAKRYRAATPVAGLLYRVTPATSVYLNAGRGFETPTFAELANRLGGSGFNFGLEAARSRHVEAGLKAHIAPGIRMNAALFEIGTRNEIVVESSAGGRATFKNAGRTRRSGLELGADAALRHGFEAALAWTRLEAKFRETLTTVAGAPAMAVTVPAGNSLPGVPRSTFYGELRWRHASSGFSAALELQHGSRVFVNDQNTEAADAYTIASIAAMLVQRQGAWRFTGFLRIDNLGDRRYAASVIVNEGNGRFYEPAPGRSVLLGAQARYAF
jgi:iron complex outermembrane receptor protein